MGFFKRHGSEPTYEAPKYEVRQPMSRHYARPRENYYGPHFEKGPQQEEIFNRRTNGERFPRDHLELRDRAHSFHHPREDHEYSDPYKKRPEPWTLQMRTEGKYYHGLSDGPETKAYKQAIQSARRTKIYTNNVPTNEAGRAIEAGIAPAIAGRIRTNEAVQAREGFAHKYPQAYESHRAIETHSGEIGRRKKSASGFRESQVNLEGMHNAWATQMRRHGIPFEGSSKR